VGYYDNENKEKYTDYYLLSKASVDKDFGSPTYQRIHRVKLELKGIKQRTEKFWQFIVTQMFRTSYQQPNIDDQEPVINAVSFSLTKRLIIIKDPNLAEDNK